MWWYLQSRNKKSLALNLKSPEAIALIKKMIVDTDILVENMRPGALEKLGLDWETLKSINPKLTFVRISGYGQSYFIKTSQALVQLVRQWVEFVIQRVLKILRLHELA